jgi:beta-lactamase regulating signal transducer with metallopeptidase domain/uncharacterized membrane protein YkoI
LLLTFVLNAIWQVSLVTAFAALGAWLLRDTACRFRHAIWVGALVLSVCLPAVTSFRLSQPVASAEILKPTQLAYTAPELSSTQNQTVAFEPLESFPGPGPLKPVISENPRFPAWPLRLTKKLAFALIAVYALLCGYHCLRLFRAWRKTKAIVTSARSVELSVRSQMLVKRCRRAAKVARARVVCSPNVPLPITAGVFNPLIILPPRLLVEEDDNVFATAVGHEFFHVARHDYLINLLLEILYLPVAFHPAAAVLRRRIKETREICCDELVARELLEPEVYARSLVSLIGSVSIVRHLPANTTIGITEADILEVRIMSLLRSSNLSRRPRALLGTAVLLLFITPCLAAASFALNLDVVNDSITPAAQENNQQRQKEISRAREELKVKERQLEELIRKNPKLKAEQLEALRRMERDLQATAAKLAAQDVEQHQKLAAERLRELQQTLEHSNLNRSVREAEMRELSNRLAKLQTSFTSDIARQYEQAQRQFEQAVEQEKIDGKVRKERETADRDEHEQENQAQEKEEREREKAAGRARLEEEDAEFARKRVELANSATVSMDRAIQVATSRYPGKVFSCGLQKQKGGKASYHVVIVANDSGSDVIRHVWVNANDGQIVKTEQEN